MKRIEDRIRVLVAERGITLLQLAHKSKITESTLHAILNRNDAKYSQLRRMAQVLSVSPSFLVGEHEDPEIPSAELPNGHVNIKTEKLIQLQQQIIDLQERILNNN
ncbi:MAG: helix-turn-helix transcriptional regulator [Bacteroidota bacterium]